MSSATPSPTTSAGTPFFSNGSGNDNGSGGGGGGGTSSSLYLFTFLATLLLLLCVSSAIILRSFILRRRFRRHVEEAFYAGVWARGDMPPGFPESAGANKKNNVGPRPVMFDAYVGKKAEHEKWDDVQPVSALAVLPPAPSNTSTPNLPTPQPISSLPPPRGLARLLPSRFIYPHQDQSQTEMTSPISAPAAPTPESVQVALLVAMPDARRAAASGSSDGRQEDRDGEELPELVLGVRKVEYRDGVRT